MVVYLIASAGRSPDDLRAGYLTGGLAKIGGGALLAALASSMPTPTASPCRHGRLRHCRRARGASPSCFSWPALPPRSGCCPSRGAAGRVWRAPRLGAASLSVALSAGSMACGASSSRSWGRCRCGAATSCSSSALDGVVGIVYALTQDSLRRFLGYSTVEHAGVVLVGLGGGPPRAVRSSADPRRRRTARGHPARVCPDLAKTLALITWTALSRPPGSARSTPRRTGPTPAVQRVALGVASLTLAAIPPLGGFVSEWFTFEALLQGFRMPTLLSASTLRAAAATLALTAGLGLLAFAKFYGFIFLGQARDRLGRVREPTRWPVGLVGTGSHPALPGPRRAVGDPRSGRGAAAATRLQSGGHHDQSPAGPTPGVRRASRCSPRRWLTITLPAYALLAAATVS